MLDNVLTIPCNHLMNMNAGRLILLMLGGAGSSLLGQELLQNGGFESGTLAGWSEANQAGGQGNFLVMPVGGVPPLSNVPAYQTAANPDGGSFFAISDTVQGGPGAHVLYQPFTIPSAGGTATLQFQLFVNNYGSSLAVNPAGLDFTASPNQHTRVDILGGSASVFDTGAGVIKNLYLGADPVASPQPYLTYKLDISDTVSAPGTYLLRFAEVDNEYWLHMGIDNVSLNFTPVPEPGIPSLLAVGALCLGLFWRRR